MTTCRVTTRGSRYSTTLSHVPRLVRTRESNVRPSFRVTTRSPTIEASSHLPHPAETKPVVLEKMTRLQAHEYNSDFNEVKSHALFFNFCAL